MYLRFIFLYFDMYVYVVNIEMVMVSIISGSGGGSSCGLLWCSWSLHKKSITSQHHHYCMLYEQLLRIHKNDTDD